MGGVVGGSVREVPEGVGPRQARPVLKKKPDHEIQIQVTGTMNLIQQIQLICESVSNKILTLLSSTNTLLCLSSATVDSETGLACAEVVYLFPRVWLYSTSF